MKESPSVLRFFGVLSVFAGWELVHYLVVSLGVSRRFLPSVQHVVTVSLPSLYIFGLNMVAAQALTSPVHSSYLGALLAIAIQSIYTIARFVTGVGSGVVLGVVLALATSLSEGLRRSIEPFLNYVRTVPLLALITVFLVWFGRAEIGKYLFTTFAITVIIFVNANNAIRNVDPIYTRAALTMGARKVEVVRTVLLPAMVPELLGGVRVILATGWAVILAAEFIAAQSGLGHILILSELYFSPGRMIVIVLVFMLYSIAINKLAELVGGRITRWQERGN